MKKIIFRTIGPAILLLLLMEANAQVKHGALVPDHLKVQYAGDIGFVSVGAGYASGGERSAADLYYGYVPKSVGGLTTHLLTVKYTWSPFLLRRRQAIRVKPFSVGVLVNYAFGRQYFSFSPDKYPFDYYKFPTSLHVGLFEGGEVYWSRRAKGMGSQWGLYYELGTIDRELISYVNNRRVLHLSDVFHLALGLRMRL